MNKFKMSFFGGVTSLAVTSANAAQLTRVATVQTGAEITGLFIHDGDLFLNPQHPDDTNPAPYNRAHLMVIEGANFSDASALSVPVGDGKNVPQTSLGELNILASAGDMGIGQIWG